MTLLLLCLGRACGRSPDFSFVAVCNHSPLAAAAAAQLRAALLRAARATESSALRSRALGTLLALSTADGASLASDMWADAGVRLSSSRGVVASLFTSWGCVSCAARRGHLHGWRQQGCAAAVAGRPPSPSRGQARSRLARCALSCSARPRRRRRRRRHRRAQRPSCARSRAASRARSLSSPPIGRRCGPTARTCSEVRSRDHLPHDDCLHRDLPRSVTNCRMRTISGGLVAGVRDAHAPRLVDRAAPLFPIVVLVVAAAVRWFRAAFRELLGRYSPFF